MNDVIEKELDILFDPANSDIEGTIEAMQRLKAATKQEDVPRLVEALKSDKNDFWTRELLSEPICEIGGADYLPQLFDALAQNYADGHDNDSFAHFLMEMAEMHPEECRLRLNELVASENPNYREYATWLLDFCN